ncbi:YicC/YloC family endoribonuclease [Aquibacillus rhizosphaerae]|uniref:YicC/YloC family endoribonuclease n=1 Tax=Aquibacillus rhizosphaerae TaxID=3051431 RepID=A0ABT7L606_9BACI|nr:YicC/YloC family endoribonuclease [Aquibacillus sp. LR5S19]MDL4840006.1 YicC/YloC family endoribonuclease [Aquibacillus sp. LR5S19]
MVTSMTGYGRNEVCVSETNISVEIRSVNHRFLDVSTKIPRSLLVLEDKLKKVVQSYFDRGRIDIFITIEGHELVERTLQINWELMDQYIEGFEKIKKRYNLAGDVPVEVVTEMSDVFTIQESSQESDFVHDSIIKALKNACRQVLEMREHEGEELVEDVKSRIEMIENTVKLLGERRDIVIMEYRDRIKERIEKYISSEFVNDDSKLYQEVALLAEKGDITEEVTRLHSHVSQFLHTITQQGAIGRKLDFILQEMHRETNTVGSKSNDVKISEWVVMLKSEIERVKEQIQNIE